MGFGGKYVIELLWKFRWWKFGGKCSVENVAGKFLAEIVGGTAIFDISELPAFQKYTMHWV